MLDVSVMAAVAPFLHSCTGDPGLVCSLGVPSLDEDQVSCSGYDLFARSGLGCRAWCRPGLVQGPTLVYL
jgi:hypothetical protein